MVPHPNNLCGGNYKDWLEVMLLPECNAACPWCVEKHGYHPEDRADFDTMLNAILASGKKNILILGGEPTLEPTLPMLLYNLVKHFGKNVYVTTNGSLLNAELAHRLWNLTGINISVHDFDLDGNAKITGLNLSEHDLSQAISTFKSHGVQVRFNCNCIQGHIDSREKIIKYVYWARQMGADSVRFSELKFEEESFVDLSLVFHKAYGLSGDPYLNGCSTDAVLCGMPVNFRQMCGLQTKLRPVPCNPQQDVEKTVLYYDGLLYDGWQVLKTYEDEIVTDKELVKLLSQVAAGTKSPTEAALLIGREMGKTKVVEVVHHETGGGCRY